MIEIVNFYQHSERFLDAVRVYQTVFQDFNFAGSVQFVRKYTGYPHFHGLLALDGDQAVGVAFGTKSEDGQWWHDKVAEQIGRDHPALQNAWVLIELGVLDHYRGQGIGTQLHNTIIRCHPLPNLLLSTQKSNHGARRLYERLGWQYLHPGFAFHTGSEPYAVMCRKV
ncbi:MAG: GNAT family N-acetyltransferase [Chloroflexi bacterium]|nr:GNAT family N-acetyltransferase [Chloroflexota bacterium]